MEITQNKCRLNTFPFSGRYDVIVTHQFTKVTRFSYRTLPKLASIQFVPCCGSEAEESCFHKMIEMTHETHVISHKIMMMECVDKKHCVFLENFMLIRSMLFELSTLFQPTVFFLEYL